MSLLDSEAGKRRLLSVEIPVIERYNEGRDPDFQIRCQPAGQHAGAALPPQAGAQRLPAGNAAGVQLPDGAAGDAGPDAAEALPAPAGRADACACGGRGARGPAAAGTRRSSPASSPSRRPGAGWPATKSGTKPANGRCPKRSDNPGVYAMAHLFQVGAGSGGMPVLDMLCRDPRITRVTLIEPDVYKPHNVERHLFPLSAVGEPKAELAAALAAGTPARPGSARSAVRPAATRASKEPSTRQRRRPTSASVPPTTSRPSITGTR